MKQECKNMSNKLCRHLAVTAFVATLALAVQSAHATNQQVTSFDGCFLDQQNTTGPPLVASGHCANRGTGGTGAALADIGTGALGAQASSTGQGNAEAEGQFATLLHFLPNQVVPLTVVMHLTGAIFGATTLDQSDGLSTGNLFEAAVMNNGTMFGVSGGDTRSGFQIITNGQSGVGGFLHAVVSATGSTARDHVDMTLTFSQTVNVGAGGLDVPIGGFVEAQVIPVGFVNGNSTTVDFLDPAGVSFTVPEGIQFTSDGFLAASASPAPEPATLPLLGAGLAAVAIAQRRRLFRQCKPPNARRAGHSTGRWG
jgi:hypothetical protein